MVRTSRRLRMSPPWLEVLQPEGRPVEWYDTEQRGLMLRVERSGRKTWATRYRVAGRLRRFILGAYPELSLRAARAAARHTLAVSLGRDPQADRERSRIGDTVELAVAAWLADESIGPAARWKGGLAGGTARAAPARQAPGPGAREAQARRDHAPRRGALRGTGCLGWNAQSPARGRARAVPMGATQGTCRGGPDGNAREGTHRRARCRAVRPDPRLRCDALRASCAAARVDRASPG